MLSGLKNLFVLLLLASCEAISAQTLYYHPNFLGFADKVITEDEAYPSTVTLARQTAAPTKITSLRIIGVHQDDFSIAQEPSYDVLPEHQKGYTQIGVIFKPLDTGSRTAQLEVVTANPLTTTVIGLLAVGVSPRTTPYVGLYNGIGPGESTVGPDGHYPTLSAAFAAITNKGGLSGGNWNFRITGSHSIHSSAYLGAYQTHGNKITFRPDAGTSPVISLNNSARLIIGRAVEDEAVPNQPTHNVTFDGSSPPDSITAELTIENNAGPGAGPLIEVVGDCDNFALRNCNLRCFPSHETNNIYAAVELLSDISYYAPTAYAFDDLPLVPGEFADNATIEKCDIVTSGLGMMLGVAMHDRPQAPNIPQRYLLYGAKSLKVCSNVIRTNAGGIIVFPLLGADIASNEIIITPHFSTNTAQIVSGIDAFGGQFGGVPATVSIYGNSLRYKDASTTHPLAAIAFQGDTDGSLFKVYNNMVTGLTGGVNSINAPTRVAIANDSEAETTAIVTHNSINITSGTPTFRGVRTYAVGSLNLRSGGYDGTMIFQNNVVRMEGGFVYNLGSGARLVADHNDIYTTRSAVISNIQSSLLGWQRQTGNDLTSIVLDPLIPVSPGKGTWTGSISPNLVDLHFSAHPGEPYLVPSIPFVSYDIDGDPRPGGFVTMGADEVIFSSMVKDWNLY